jgi:hypothetical protein
MDGPRADQRLVCSPAAIAANRKGSETIFQEEQSSPLLSSLHQGVPHRPSSQVGEFQIPLHYALKHHSRADGMGVQRLWNARDHRGMGHAESGRGSLGLVGVGDLDRDSYSSA